MIWKEKHPANFIAKKDKYLIDGFFDALPTLAPNEMFRVMQEREEPLTVMKHNDLSDLFWLFFHEWRKTHSLWYRFLHGKPMKSDYQSKK